MKYGLAILIFLLFISNASAYSQTVNITFDSIEEYQPEHIHSGGGFGNATIVNSTEYFAQFNNYSDIWEYSKIIHIPEMEENFDVYYFYENFEISYEDESFKDIRFIIPEVPFSYSSMYMRWGFSY